MANILSQLKIAHKLGLSACAFAIPIAFILWSLIAGQNVAIDFASKEVLGARYLGGIAELQGELDKAALDKTGVPGEAAETLAALGASTPGLKTKPRLDAAISALRAANAPSSVASARAKLHDLIDQVADRSNLTLDNVLATNHLADVTLNGLPDAVDRIADLTLAQGNSIKDPKAQARFLVGLGALEGDLDSTNDSLTAAEQAEGGARIKMALNDEYQNLRTGLTGFVKDLKAGQANPEAAREQVAQVTHFSQSVAQEMAELLKARVARLHRAEMRMFGITLLLFVAAVLGMLWVLRYGVTRPLAHMTGAMRKLAAGDLGVEVPCIGRGDEIGGMAGAVQVFKDNALRTQTLEQEQEQARRAAEAERNQREAEHEVAAKQLAFVVESVAAGLEKLAAGTLTFRLSQVFAPEYEQLRTDFNAALDRLQDAMKVIVANTTAIRSGTGEISAAADDLSRRTEQQAASLEETAAALDQITATVRKTAEGATHAREVVGAAQDDAERSGAVVREAVTAMSKIETSSQQISNIIGVIDEIAFQTNLLALNAGVEAARAGDAGRGFAVVASEVRALAQRSADAAKEIKALISTSTKQVVSGVDLVGQTGKALQRIVSQIGEINGVVVQIAASAQEQATGLHQVNAAVNQMDQVTQQNAAMVEQSTAASHSLAQETEELAGLIGRFQISEGMEPPVRNAPRKPAPVARLMHAPKPPAAKPAARASAQRKLEVVADADNWEEF